MATGKSLEVIGTLRSIGIEPGWDEMLKRGTSRYYTRLMLYVWKALYSAMARGKSDNVGCIVIWTTPEIATLNYEIVWARKVNAALFWGILLEDLLFEDPLFFFNI